MTDAMPRQDLKLPPPIGYISREEHAALIREAEARGMERAAAIADHFADQDYAAMGYPEDGGIAASGTAYMIQQEIRAEAASIRAAKDTP